MEEGFQTRRTLLDSRGSALHEPDVLERLLDPNLLGLQVGSELTGGLVEIEPAALAQGLLPLVARDDRLDHVLELLLLRRLEAGLGEDAAPVDELEVDALFLECRRGDV